VASDEFEESAGASAVSSEEPGHGCAEIASGEQFCGKEARDVLTDLLGGEGFGFFLGMEVTEMRMAGAARSAALAAVGKGEGTQLGERSFLGLTLERTFSCVDAERPTERFVDMEVS
jgi:hypothetical protein